MVQYDLISIGDSTIDLFMEVDPQDTQTVCKLDDATCQVCFEFGAKIPVSKMERIPAVGNAANNAIGSTRLGLKTAIYTVIGSDKDSEEIKGVFEREDVGTKFIVMESDKTSNLHVVISYSGERTIFVHHQPREYDISSLPQASWIYFSSVAKDHEKIHQQIPEYVKKYNAKMGFNPGSFQLRDGIEKLGPILQNTEVLSVNREEAHALAGGDLEDIKGLFSRLKATGPQTILITDGRNGSYSSYDGREIWYVGIPEESIVVERTGCGDAYTTAFLVAIMEGKELPDAMVDGTLNATSVIQYIGARQGLLTKSGLEEFRQKYGEELKPKMF